MVFENEKWQRKSPIFWEHEGSRAVRDGEWKLVCEVGSNWEIYNMSQDRTELTNLLNEEQDRVHSMKAQYREWSDRCEESYKDSKPKVERKRLERLKSAREEQNNK